jgi:predicted TIM-barrel fold metal-dependent hydrolase
MRQQHLDANNIALDVLNMIRPHPRLLFATDYPHWDYDDPTQVPPFRISQTKQQQFFIDNARALYCT